MSKKARKTDGPATLAELLAYMASRKPGERETDGARTEAAKVGAAARPASPAALLKQTLPEPAQLDYFRELWAGVNANRQLKQSQERVPDNAGPLNSSHLVYRSLTLMRELSPGYLRHFLAHVEALSWMDRLSEAAGPGKETPRQSGGRKGARSR